ncbi:MAG: YHS domain-containing protein [Thermoproteota archaeon]
MGKTYYFCNQMCKTTFDKNPAKYAGGHSEHSGHCCH